MNIVVHITLLCTKVSLGYMHLENIILSEITKSQKNRHNMQSLIMGYKPQKALNTPETTQRLCEAQQQQQKIHFNKNRTVSHLPFLPIALRNLSLIPSN